MLTLINDGWQFGLLDVDTPDGYEYLTGVEYEPVAIPHDWLIYDTSDLYRDGLGVYRRSVNVDDASGGHTFLIFDGVYMDCTCYINGIRAGEWKYGYSQFVLDITDYVEPGENELVVSVRHRSPNTRWYSGAGIYRDVWLMRTADVYIPANGVYVHTKCNGDSYTVKAEVEICGSGDADKNEYEIDVSMDGYRGIEDGDAVFDESRSVLVRRFSIDVPDPHLWDTQDPYLYDLKVTLKTGDDIQNTQCRVGLRDIRMDPEKGFFLNGRNMKLNGVCEHHDLGVLGAEFNRSAMRRKFEILKTMGVNAVRGTHNMMAPGMLDLADEMGILFISEAFDMWEHPKTEYDYARFFDKWHEKDVASWIRRDRNHPCVILWSIGNEISDIHADANRGTYLTSRLKSLVELHDPEHNAYVTHGSNYMPWENAQKSADILKIVGYNYGESCYREHHRLHPDWVIFGSETSSIVQSRGVYHFPLSTNVLGEDDMQCSALGNSPSSWSAKSYEICAGLDRDMEFSMGQFLWSGFDYIGEPTPYHTRSSYFGQIDTAGFPKDSYYLWRSVWTDPDSEPFVHIFPYWDFNEGQRIDIRVVSNLDEVELFLNGQSLGRQTLDHAPGSGLHLIADYSAEYVPGELKAYGYASGEKTPSAQCIQRSFSDTSSLVVKKYEFTSGHDADELAFFEISALDPDGNPVMNACDKVHVKAVNGELIGLDNGDSYDPDGYRTDTKRLFNGKLLAVVRPSDKGHDAAHIEAVRVEDSADARRITLTTEDSRVLDPDNMNVCVSARIFPESARDNKIVFRAVDDSGVDSRLVDLDVKDDLVYITAKGDGTFRLRATTGNEWQPVRIISELEYEIRDVGCAYFDPYKLISGSSYTSCIGEVGNGNEKGFATARDKKTVVTFADIDFGRIGSSEVTVPIFYLDGDEVPFKLWEGIPGEEGSRIILEALYAQKMIWNTYIEQTFRLNTRLTGKTTISFEFHDKVHVKGFVFTPDDIRDVTFYAGEADSIYGDTFVRNDVRVEGIGNNVSLEFNNMDLGENGIDGISVCGRTRNTSNPVHVKFTRPDEEIREVCEFDSSDEYVFRDYKLPHISGVWNISFVFLPGSSFDFESFRLF